MKSTEKWSGVQLKYNPFAICALAGPAIAFSLTYSVLCTEKPINHFTNSYCYKFPRMNKRNVMIVDGCDGNDDDGGEYDVDDDVPNITKNAR